jgi:hypothetical protein
MRVTRRRFSEFAAHAVFAVLFASSLFAPVSTIAQRQSTDADAEVRKAIIAQSLAGYPGPCPCPYNTARNGSRCGKRSAYSKPGGYEPICYDNDVTPAMIAKWRKEHATDRALR